MQQMISQERKEYLKKIRRNRWAVFGTQFSVLIFFIFAWEMLANAGVIDSFITSQPSKIINTWINLSQNGLLEHLGITCKETIIGFLLRYRSWRFDCHYLVVVKIFMQSGRTFFSCAKQFAKSSFRSHYHYLGGGRNQCHYYHGNSHFTYCYYHGNFEWV